jgi:hypothetical protein
MDNTSFATSGMSRVAVMVRAVACAMALAACGSSGNGRITELVDSGTGPIHLRLRNSGPIALTSVNVLVADDVAPITADVLQPGQTLSFVSRARAHTDPAVSAKAGGRALMSQPIEGFSGFNPPLADGRYTIGLEVANIEGTTRLIVRVVKEP